MKSIGVFLITVFSLLVFSNLAMAATFTPMTANDLQNALNTAAGNDEADTIILPPFVLNVADNTVMGAPPNTFMYTSTKNFPLTIEGDPTGLSILDGNDDELEPAPIGAARIMDIDVSGAGPDAHVTIQDVTFRNGDGDDGAGLRVNADGSGGASILLDGCFFLDNISDDNGGGANLDTDSGDITVMDCDFFVNSADNNGGGLDAETDTGSISLSGCRFEGNEAGNDDDGFGGGANLEVEDTMGGTITVDDCLFVGNFSDGDDDDEGGGGLFAQTLDGAIEVKNSKFEDSSGGGAYLATEDADITVEGCFFAGNFAGDDGGGLKARTDRNNNGSGHIPVDDIIV